MQNSNKRKIVLCYFFGFVDFLGQSKNISKDGILEVTGRIFFESFDMSESEAVEALECVINASQEFEGRKYIRAGAVALSDLIEGNTKTANLPLTALLDEVS